MVRTLVAFFWAIYELVHFARGRMKLEAYRLDTAELDLNRFLNRQPNHLEALVARARLQSLLGKHLVAARDYDRAITHLRNPTPEYFLERATALVLAGDV